MREHKETGVHGTLYKTFNSRMNIIETRAVLELTRAV